MFFIALFVLIFFKSKVKRGKDHFTVVNKNRAKKIQLTVDSSVIVNEINPLARSK